jgi:hypothetical protein
MQFAIWREQDAMRQCGIGFGVIPRLFRDQKRFRLIAAASINCDFPGRPAAFHASMPLFA